MSEVSAPDLFASGVDLRPLAERMRPLRLDEIVGQDSLLGAGKPLRRALESGQPHSMVLWGPPGCGKTTLALLVAQLAKAEFVSISAVMSGLPDVRKALGEAQQRFNRGERTLMFVDEVHRFNKAQQDAFLPHIERGTIVFIGATTENPSFELNSALLSRCRVHVLKAVEADDIVQALRRALADAGRGLGQRAIRIDDATLRLIAQAADGDVRRGLTLLEIASDLAVDGQIDEATLASVVGEGTRRFDKRGEQFYDQISALHKCVRSSNPDAALYWLARMLDGGCDPAYLARRITRMATEDVGLADPRALDLCLAAWDCFERLGSPEGELALAQAVVYLACAPRSNAVYAAWKAAQADVRAFGTADVPLHLRNAPTKLMKGLGYGENYQYDHDSKDGVALDQTGFPDVLGEREYYQPVERGLEIRIAEKLTALRAARRKTRGDR